MEQRELKGHRSAVNCLDCPSSSGRQLLISGSEDRTVRVWDIATSKSVKCFHGCFAGDIEAVSLSRKDENIVFVVTTETAYSFDMRKDCVLDSVPFSSCNHRFEDISAVAFSPKDNVIAVADNSECIHLIHLDSLCGFINEGVRKLRQVHRNNIGALAFSERKKEVISGGYDFLLCKWDVDLLKPSKRIEVESLSNIESSKQTLNPPFITGIQYIPGQPVLATTFGDGSVSLIYVQISCIYFVLLNFVHS